MKIAVLGGTRFIGPFLVRALLQKGHRVDVYHRGKTACEFPAEVRHVTIDRNLVGQTAAALSERRPDAVIDMSGFRPSQVREVLTAGLDLHHYVFCSSTSVYGRIGTGTPTESTPINARSDYERGKAGSEHKILSIHHESGIPVTILRLAHPYGPGDHLVYGTGRDSLFLDRMRHGRSIVIPGSGDSRMHPIYVGDIAWAFVHVLGRRDCLGRIYNLAGDEILTLNGYFASIGRVLERPVVTSHVPASWFAANTHLWSQRRRNFDFAPIWCEYEGAFDVRALHETGFRCKTDHDSGVAATIAWLKEKQLIPASSDEDLEDIVQKEWESGDQAASPQEGTP